MLLKDYQWICLAILFLILLSCENKKETLPNGQHDWTKTKPADASRGVYCKNEINQ